MMMNHSHHPSEDDPNNMAAGSSSLLSLETGPYASTGCCNINGVCGNNNNTYNIINSRKRRSNSPLDTDNNITTITEVETTDNVDADDTAYLAEELNKLSVDERNKLYDEIHGVSQLTEESTEFLNDLFPKFDVALEKLPKHKRIALDRAIFLKPSLLNDNKFKLIFLRSDYYDPKKAAERFAEYYENKRNLFGDSKLVKKITLDDLPPDDMEVFRKGGFMMLPQTDNVGRPIWISDIYKSDFTRPDTLKRIAWYMVMTTVLENEISQLKGVSNIYYGLDCEWTSSINLQQFTNGMNEWGKVIPRLPCRVTSDHFCTNNIHMKFALSTIRSALGKHLQLRVRAHFGSGVEVQYSLLTYGIQCPFNNSQTKKLLHQQFIQQRLQIERNEEKQKQLMLEKQQQQQQSSNDDDDDSDSNNDIILLCPNPNDVLVGRGLPYQTHTGNILLGELIENKYLMTFIKAKTKMDKTYINLTVMKDVIEKGGRFLERCPSQNGWKIVNNQPSARKKVNSAFRSKVTAYNNNINKNRNKIENNSTTNNPTTFMTNPTTQQQQFQEGEEEEEEKMMMMFEQQQQQQQQEWTTNIIMEEQRPPSLFSNNNNNYFNNPLLFGAKTSTIFMNGNNNNNNINNNHITTSHHHHHHHDHHHQSTKTNKRMRFNYF